MFGKLLIANRGEIACRIARTARRLGIGTVAVFSDADAHAAHVAACDEAVHIGGARPQESYLRGEVILDAARQARAAAIHPGYGFLSENADFARACGNAGVVFVGPTPEAIAAMGSKSAAKALMEKAGVPLTPGYHGQRQEAEFLLEEARRIGFPVLIKAVAGGGGKGMRRVDRVEEFAAALAGCRREAQASFGDDRVLVEKYLSPARHIEVQVFGDTHGNVVYLFERDCSVQRRHQKVIEEAPAPGMTVQRRRQMGEAAVAAARAVDYVGAGTVEFIAAPDGTFYFMEMNTRLQVEHPVTEMITGLDLVEWQLRVAAGEPLPRRQDELTLKGHAIEARIYAEDPARDFLPSIGILEYLSTPATSREVRIDTGVRQGDSITPYYDPMIAKLIVHGADRAEALARLRAALGEYHVAGVQTNVEFLHRLTGAASFVEPRLDTALIERERDWLFAPRGAPSRLAWNLAVLAHVLSQRRPPSQSTPWEDSSGWRLGAAGQRHNKVRCGGQVVAVKLTFLQSTLLVDVGGDVDILSGTLATDGLLEGNVDESLVRARAHLRGNRLHLFHDSLHHVFEWVDPYLPEIVAADRHGGLVAPMPGRVIAVLVKQGARVSAGTALLVMEAMKMEHTVTAPANGTIAAIHHEAGDQVREGDELLTITPVE
ncbi:MAG TPA: acetyl/propionyl/methylcrotonyl-CoA carboxylase subunit alpha [Steroidobacteraceae bacterium]|nr:acetyl/propionyl/methylcrotonyl-CoA carboxylase subunit alpha [Steroidobacteraceae bacterium]